MINPQSRLYYIEGPDGSGKSTLIDKARIANDIVIHNGPYDTRDDAFYAYDLQIEQAREALFLTDSITVYIDRGPLSELIYGEVIRGNEELDLRLYTCFQKLKELNATIIICLPPIEVAYANWISRLDEEYVKNKEQYRQIYRQYVWKLELLKKYEGEVIIYDYTTKKGVSIETYISNTDGV